MNTPQADRALLKQLSILYVEDDDATREQLSELLRRWFGAVHLAADGQQGLYLFSRHRPDLVVTDIQMPVMDGLQLAKTVKEMDRDVPVIFTTAFNDQDYFLRAIEIGVDRFVTKPVDIPRLQEALANAARVQQERREILVYRERAEEELRVTHHLMEWMMGGEALRDERVRFRVEPAERFSGDLVAAQQAPNGDLFVILADATGHGLPAAISLLAITRVFYRMVGKGHSLSSVVAEMNRTLREQLPADRFVAATVARVDAANRLLEVWNGGTPAARFLDGEGRELRVFPSSHLPLGVAGDDLFDARPEAWLWERTGTLLLCSDGVVEAENAAGEFFGEHGLLEAWRTRGMSCGVDCVLESVKTHVGNLPHHDDLSLVAVACGA